MSAAPRPRLALLLALAAGVTGTPAMAQSASPHATLAAYPDAMIRLADAASGVEVTIEPDGRTLSARGRDGAQLWRSDVVALAGPPGTGAPVARALAIRKGETLFVTLGKTRVVELRLADGSLVGAGEN